MSKIKLKALSIAQPWAECIVSQGKNVENRSWNTKYRGFFAIHASRGIDLDRFEYCFDDYGIKFDPEKLSFGAIVGIAELVDVVTEDSLTRRTRKWFMGEYGFVLENVIRLKKPVPVKGALSFWQVTGRPLKSVLDQLTNAQTKAVLARPLQQIS